MAISERKLPSNLHLHALEDGNALAQCLARRVAEALSQALHAQGTASLMVSGGRSPIAFFEALSGYALDWHQVQVGLVDERWVAPDQEGSNEGLLRRYLLRNAATAAQLMGLYDAKCSPEQAAQRAGQRLAALKHPIDVLVLGMGDDGHTASLFPDSPNLAHALARDCTDIYLPMQAPVEPRQRISLSYPPLISARLRCLSIQGTSKLETLHKALALNAQQMPIRAFLDQPLEVYWCP